MRKAAVSPRRPPQGFTLVEMLVVIAVIAALVSILAPTLAVAKRQAKIKVAKLEMAGIVLAISQYQALYSLPPLSRTAIDSCTPSSPDFTCGTVWPDGSPLCQPKIISTGNSGYHNCNSEVMAILMDLDLYPNTNHLRNPQRHPFLPARLAPKANAPGVGLDGVFRDPWGNPYIVTIDVNYDGVCQDGFYYPLTKPGKPLLVRGSVMVWSFGPDGKADPNPSVGPNGGANKDNILSWEEKAK
jgi:prepilin-type N-terminal cleavage/methylation domain-containing protein